MSDCGYIYVKNWEQIQGRRDRNDPWHKVYNELLRHDAYTTLSLADRGTLHGIWMLASSTGDGRVTSSRTFLARQLNVRRVSLEPLIQAGFIEIRAAKRPRVGGLEEIRREEIKPPTPFDDETNGSKPKRRKPEAETLEAAFERHRIVRELLPFPMRERWVSDEVLDQFTPADCKILIAAWGRSNDLRDNGQRIEEAANPRAYALAIAGSNPGAP